MTAIHCPADAMTLHAEREYLTILGGSCNAPCGAYCRREGDKLAMSVMFARDGQHPLFARKSAELAENGRQADENLLVARKLAEDLAEQVRLRPVSLVGPDQVMPGF